MKTRSQRMSPYERGRNNRITVRIGHGYGVLIKAYILLGMFSVELENIRYHPLTTGVRSNICIQTQRSSPFDEEAESNIQ